MVRTLVPPSAVEGWDEVWARVTARARARVRARARARVRVKVSSNRHQRSLALSRSWWSTRSKRLTRCCAGAGP